MLLKRVIPDAETSNPDAIVVPTTPNESMAKFQEWLVSIHPGYTTTTGMAFNMANGGSAAGNYPVRTTTFSNGALGFDKSNDGTTVAQAYNNVELPPDNVSVFFVLEADDLGVRPWNNGLVPLGFLSGSTTPGLPLRLFFNQNNGRFMLYEDENIRRVEPTAYSLWNDTWPHLWMMTFSTTNGLVLYRDGQVIAANPDDKRPFNSKLSPGATPILYNSPNVFDAPGAKCVFSEVHIVGRDLSLPENTAYRLNIERFMMTYYGVAQP